MFDNDFAGFTCGDLLRQFREQAHLLQDESERRSAVAQGAAGLLQEELAERAGLTGRGIRKIENGESVPNADTVRALSDALALSPEQRALFERAADREREARDVQDHARRAAMAASRKTNLPAPVSGFVGREDDIAEIGQALRRARLVTLVGAGGCGKTQLAIKVATELRAEYPDGVWLVRLEALESPDALLPTVARTLGVREAENDLRAALIVALRRKQTLLLLDNCEHLVIPCAELAEALLEGCPRLHILATSREALRLLSWEEAWRVPSLALPPARRRIPLGELARYDAVQLFVRRARDFTLTEENAPAVARICGRLDGIPLAIELAVARLPVLSVHELAERLDAHVQGLAGDDQDERFQLLTDRSRTSPPRQRTLVATMAWSYNLLSDTEQALLQRLAIFAGGWTLDAAEAVCAADAVERGAVLDLLTVLADKSLVQAPAVDTSDRRYGLLETVRQYGRARLEESGETTLLRRRHRDWYLQEAEQAAAEWLEPGREARSNRLEADHDNYRSALAWSLSRSNEAVAGARLAAALWRFWEMRGYLTEGRDWLERALTASEELPEDLRVRIASGIGHFAADQNDHETAIRLLDAGLSFFREHGDTRDAAFSLLKLGTTAHFRGDHARATALLRESLSLYEAMGDKPGVANALDYLAYTAMSYPDAGDPGDLFEQSLSLSRQIEEPEYMASALFGLAYLAFFAGDIQRARSLIGESLALYRSLGLTGGVAMTVEGFAALSVVEGNKERAARLFAAADVAREAINAPRPPSYGPVYDSIVSVVRADFPDAWAEGQALTLDEAVDIAAQTHE